MPGERSGVDVRNEVKRNRCKREEREERGGEVMLAGSCGSPCQNCV